MSPLVDDRLVFLGDDQTGRALEVVGIETTTGLHVIHVMDLRPKWRPYYEKDGTQDGRQADRAQRCPAHGRVGRTAGRRGRGRLRPRCRNGRPLRPRSPSLSGDQTSPQVTFRLPGELRAKAEERARREGKTLSALAREAMERYLAS